MKSLRTTYQPLQPSLTYAARKHVRYQEQFPEEALQDYIYCYWQLKTEQPLDQPFVYRVVSDGCIDVLWEYSEPDKIFITGFSPAFLEFPLGKDFNYLGIRFLPCAFPQLYGLSAAHLSNQFLMLEHVLPQLAQEISLLAEALAAVPFTNVQAVLDEYFLQHTQRHPPPPLDERLQAAMDLIIKSKGTIPLKSLQVGLSQRQLRRLFHYYFGASPKVFGKIIQFQQFLATYASAQKLKEEKIFYDVGYYDQAHFIKAFKKCYGLTPGQVFDTY